MWREHEQYADLSAKESGRMGNVDNYHRNFIWNTMAGLVNASEAVLLLMVVGRTNGLEDAGILTIAFAVGNLMITIGNYGVRNFQVTDVDEIISFSVYFTHRVCTVLLMGSATGGYLLYSYIFNAYSVRKVWTVLLICMIYMVESLDDVFWGLYQKNGRIDIGAKIFVGRWSLHLIITSIGLVVTHQLVQSLVLGFLAGAVLSAIANIVNVSDYYKGKLFQWNGVVYVFYCCFPLFIVAFLTNYVSNAPKYAIDKYMQEADQACYGYIAMPVFVVMLFSSFVYQPILTNIANEWKEKNVLALQRRILKIVFLIVGLTIICFAGAWICGIPILSALYATDLTPYKKELLILMIAGGCLGLVSFESTILTVIRKQKITMKGYIIIAILAKLFFGYEVRYYGLTGAASLYALLMGVLSLFYGAYIWQQIQKCKNEEI